MAEFTPIESQEELDKFINERLKRERETSAKKYEGWISPDDQKKASTELQKRVDDLTKASADQSKKYAEYDKTLAEKEAKIKEYETDSVKTRIALTAGLPYEMSSRLRGDSEEEIQKDADALVKMMGNKKTAPLAETESDVTKKSSTDAAFRDMLHKLNG